MNSRFVPALLAVTAGVRMMSARLRRLEDRGKRAPAGMFKVICWSGQLMDRWCLNGQSRRERFLIYSLQGKRRCKVPKYFAA